MLRKGWKREVGHGSVRHKINGIVRCHYLQYHVRMEKKKGESLVMLMIVREEKDLVSSSELGIYVIKNEKCFPIVYLFTTLGE